MIVKQAINDENISVFENILKTTGSKIIILYELVEYFGKEKIYSMIAKISVKGQRISLEATVDNISYPTKPIIKYEKKIIRLSSKDEDKENEPMDYFTEEKDESYPECNTNLTAFETRRET